VDHAALERAGSEQGDFGDQVIECPGLIDGEEVYLSLGFDLEQADGAVVADHVIDLFVVEGDVVDICGRVVGACSDFDGFAQGGEHTEAEHIEFDESEGFHIVFVELDHFDAVGGYLYRGEVGEWFSGQYHAADVEAEVTGAVFEAFHQVEEEFEQG
jgi:hypothetical protein